MRRHHFTVLTALSEAGAVSQAELGRRLWLDRSDLHAVLSDLERDGFVARVRDEADRRRNLVAAHAGGDGRIGALGRSCRGGAGRAARAAFGRGAPLLASLLERVVAHHRG